MESYSSSSMSNPNPYQMLELGQPSSPHGPASSSASVERAAQQALAMLQQSAASPQRPERPQSAHPALQRHGRSGGDGARHQHARRMSVSIGAGQPHPTHAPLNFGDGNRPTASTDHPRLALVNFGPRTAPATPSSPPHNAVSPAPFRPYIVSPYDVVRNDDAPSDAIVAFVRDVPQGMRGNPTSSSGRSTSSSFFSSGEEEEVEMLYHDRRTSTTPASHASPAPDPNDHDSQA